MAGEGAHQRAPAALGPQRRVDRPGDQPADRASAGWRPRWPAARSSSSAADEDDVHVGDVVQLPAAALAHRHHGQPGRRGARRQLGHGELVRGAPGWRRPAPRARPSSAPGRARRSGRPPRSAAAPAGTPSAAPRPVRPPSAGSSRPSAVGAQPVRGGAAAARSSASGVGDQVVAERGRGTEHRDQPPAQPRVGRSAASSGDPPSAAAVMAAFGLHDAVQLAQRQVRVGGAGQRGEQLAGALVGRLLALRPPQPQPVRAEQVGGARAAVAVGGPKPYRASRPGCAVGRRHQCPSSGRLAPRSCRRPARRGPARRTGRRTAARPPRCRPSTAAQPRPPASGS